MVLKFFCSEMYPNPGPWKESQYGTELETIKKFCVEEFWVYDCDGGSEETYLFVFSTGKYFKVFHDFYWTGWDDERYLDNTFDITEITKEQADKISKDSKGYIKLCSDRDFLHIDYNMINYPEKYYPKAYKELAQKVKIL